MPPVNQQPSQDYDFIVNSATAPKQSPLSNASKPKRIALVAGGLLLLFIIFTVIKGVLSGPSPTELYLPLVKDQQQLIQLANTASQQQGLSTVSTNSALTVQAALASDQTATLDYMSKNGKKLHPKEYTVGLSGALTDQLQTATQAGTYDTTYKDVMSQELQAYSRHLQQVYKQTNGQKGHDLLTKNYQSAELLIQQLQNP